MRKLSKIITAAKTNEPIEMAEAIHAICVLESLSTFDRSALMKLYKAEVENKKPFLTSSAEWQLNERLKRNQIALNKSPREWLGWNNSPDNPEYVKRVKAAEELCRKIIKNKKG